MTISKLQLGIRVAVIVATAIALPHLSAATAVAQETTADAQNAEDQDRAEPDVATRDIDDNRIPQVVSGRFVLPSMQAASIATAYIGNGRTPEGFREQNVTPMQSLPEDASQRGDHWHWSVCNWAASNTFSYPRYFEDRMLERHGHERFGNLQPLASGARFFATVPMLPYLGAIRPPCECEYSLGYYRPGSCTSALKQRPPYDRRAVIAETAALTSAFLIFP
ncbi:MAG: hypothetical protein AB8B91_04475 [Rubripirellula sp.]